MRREVLKKGTAIMLLLTLLLTVIHLPVQAADRLVTKAVVDTQKELNAALNNKNITSITIQTNKEVKLSIPRRSYTSKRVYVKAPKATIENSGKFKSVNMFVSSQAQLEKALENTSIKFTYLTISTTESKEFKLTGDFGNVGLIVNAPKARVVNNADFKSVNVYVASQEQLEAVLKDSKVTAVTINTKDNVELTIPEGSYTNIKLIVTAPNATIVNNGEFKSTTVNDGKVTVPETTVTPTPTPTAEPTSPPSGNNSSSGNTTPSTPATPTPDTTLADLQSKYMDAVADISDKIYKYKSNSEWIAYLNGNEAKWVGLINNSKTVPELESNFAEIQKESKEMFESNERYIKDNPYFTNVITQEQLVADYYRSLNADGTFYEFTTNKEDFGIGKKYYVPVSAPADVNTFVLENPETVINVTTGSAIIFNVKAWNNLNGAEDITAIWNLVMDSVDENGLNPFLDKLVEGVDYQVIDNSIIINGKVTNDAPLGRYGFAIQTQVPYLDKYNTSYYVYVNIVAK